MERIYTQTDINDNPIWHASPQQLISTPSEQLNNLLQGDNHYDLARFVSGIQDLDQPQNLNSGNPMAFFIDGHSGEILPMYKVISYSTGRMIFLIIYIFRLFTR
jgi:hypothetical protein